ncbi:MAG: argininosuccinate synthase [Candidatus Nitrosotenuis sp.]|jgi:argininosuccinate synthase|uniref:argininosuccinate synthase n=1 Tax=Candidatus Nitrosotenuis cloacae TaxID=1603555 RepID=UPI00227F7130|nr:argininosuccinate synthase [Candidatus Nitrosotenuis cloacae]MDC8437983.1 argininosuccinate synthase [Candidatus Nitrosotenuis sp.]
MKQKAVLAFSGGLDTSVVIKYLQEKHRMDVITVTVDVGEGSDQKKIAAKAKKLGVLRHYNLDARKEFVENYIYPAIKANALYQKKYCLATSLARPLIAQKVLEVAKKEKVDALAHGCTGKGNDQVRFDVTFGSGSNLPIIAPIRDLNLDRTTELEFANKHGIPIDSVSKKFSIDQNLWGRAIEGGNMEDPYAEPPDDAFIWVKTRGLPDKPRYMEIEFQNGVPVAIDKKRMTPIRLIEYANRVAGSYGVGIVDHIEDRVVGIKSREVYETPGALCIIEAHSDLEKMVHTKHENKFKEMVDQEWAWLAYSGLWQDPLKRDLDRFIDQSQKVVTGTVRLKLHKGSLRVVGRKSKYSLYSHNIATYGKGSAFDQRKATGFVELWGLQTTEANKLLNKR